MAEKEKKKSPAELKAEARQVANANLASGVLPVAVSYLLDGKKGEFKGEYGEAGGQAHYLVAYANAMQNAGRDPQLGGVLGNAHAQAVYSNIGADGDRYAETVSGRQVAEAAYKTIFGPSVAHATVGDLLKAMQYEGKVPKDIAELYVGDVLGKGSQATKEQKEYVTLVLQEFKRRIADRSVGLSLVTKTAMDNKGLEGMLNPEEKPKK